MTCHYKLSLQCFKCLKLRATNICSRERPLKDDLPEEWLSTEIHYKCNEAEDQTGGSADIDRSIQSHHCTYVHAAETIHSTFLNWEAPSQLNYILREIHMNILWFQLMNEYEYVANGCHFNDHTHTHAHMHARMHAPAHTHTHTAVLEWCQSVCKSWKPRQCLL